MKKQRGIYIVLLVLILIVSLMAVAACTDPNLDGEDEENNEKPTVTYTQNVKNGTFYSSYNQKGKNYLKTTVDNWTATKGQTAVSNVKFGAIDMTEELWNAGIGSIAENLAYPGIAPNSPKKTGSNELQDTMAAVVAYTSNVGSAYFISSSSTIEKGKKYKLSIDVATFVLKSDGTAMNRTESVPDGKGAYIFVTGGVYNSVEAINTEGKWDTISIYLEGKETENVTFNVQLWLGHSANYVNGGETNTRLTNGVMLFDNVILEEVGADEFDNAAISDNDNNVSYVVSERADAVNGTADGTVHKFSAKYFDDANFEYNTAYSSYTTSSSASSTRAYYSAKVGTPYKFTRIMGKTGLTADYPTTYANSYYYPDGIFDLSKIYTYNEETGFTDTYAKINTSEWAAPNWEDFYKLTDAGDTKKAEYDNNSYLKFVGNFGGDHRDQIMQKDNNTRVLAIYNKGYSGLGFRSNSKMTATAGKFYSITTYVYLYKALELPNTAVTGLTEEQAQANIDALNKFISEDVTAKIKLTGVTFAGESNYGTQSRTLDTSRLFGQNDADAFNIGDFYEEKTSGDDVTYDLIDNADLPYIDAEGKWVTALGAWQEVTFKVAANTLSSRNIGIEFWLGEGTANDEYPVLQKGGAIFDGINIIEGDNATDAAFSALSEESQSLPFITLSTIDIGDGADYDIYDMTTPVGDFTEFTAGESQNGYTFDYLDGINNTEGAATAGFINYMDKEQWDAAGYAEKFGEYPGFTKVFGSDSNEYGYGMLVLKHKAFTASTLTLNDETSEGYSKLAKIYPNRYYRLGVMVKTEGVVSGTTLTLALILRNTASDKTAINSISSFTTVNTDGEWKEYVFYISGAVLANVRDENGNPLDANRVGLQLAFGSGDAYNSSTHAKGTVYLTGINFSSVSNSEFSDASSGDTVKKHSFTTSAYTSDTSTNGLFTNVSYGDTVSNAEQVELGTVDKSAGSFEVKGIGTFYFNLSSNINSEIYSDAARTVKADNFGKIVYTTDTTGYIEYVLEGGADFRFMINANRISASAYDDRGNLIILGAHQDGWSNNSFVYDKLSSPSVENRTVKVLDGENHETDQVLAYTIRWGKIDGAQKYEIYYNQNGNSSDKLRVYCGTPVAEGGETTDGVILYENGNYVYFKLPSAVAGTYYVRAIPQDLNAKKVSEFGSVTVSSKMNEMNGEDEKKKPTNQGWERDFKAEITDHLTTFDEIPDPKSYRGIIDYKHFDRNIAGMSGIDNQDAAEFLDNLSANLYAESTSGGGAATDGRFNFGNFSSDLYNNVLMLYSDVATYGGLTMSSTQTLSANSYYYISVWVLTVGSDTKAAVSLDISSKIYTNNNDFKGYYNINTAGTWREYRFIAKVGVTSATIKLGLSLGRKYVENSSTKYEYSKGLVFFDNVTVKTLTEDEYTAFMTDGEGNTIDEWKLEEGVEQNIHGFDKVSGEALDKVFYNNDFAYVALDYVTDSFDTAGTSLDSSDLALGYTPSDYTHGMATSGVNNSDARSYGVYKFNELNDERHSKFWKDTELNGKSWYNETINDLDSAKRYLEGFGANTLMMVNYVDNGQYYRSNTRTLNSKTYYLISFYAKALLPEGAYAEFRFVHGNDTTKHDTVYIKGGGEEENGFRLYEMYIQNDASSSISSSYFSFNLGSYDSTKGVKNFVSGMLVVDNVTMTTITAEDYAGAVARFDAIPEAERKDAGMAYYKFETADETGSTDDGGDDEENKNDGSISAQTWLIISSAVIGAMILIAVVVVMIRQFKKKYVRTKVIGENKFDAVKKTEIEIKQQQGDLTKRVGTDREEFED